MEKQKIGKIHYIINVGAEELKSSAAVNRLRAFQKGLLQNGYRCELIFPYERKHFTPCMSKPYAITVILLKLIFSKKKDIFILYGMSNILSLILKFKKKIKVLVEITEYPYSLTYEKYKSNVKQDEDFLSKLKYIDGLITCSDALSKYYSKYLDNQPIFKAPLIVDVKKFLNAKPNNMYKTPYLGYCGSLVNNKDGVFNLLNSFSKFSHKLPEYNLYIVGGGWEEEILKVNELIRELKLTEKVFLTGKIPHEKMPSFLKGASVLVLARPNNKQAEGGVPSKVGEYLSSGVPNVVTNVGELSEFMKDGYNCFMSEPDNNDMFAEKMIEACISKTNKQISENQIATAYKYDISEQSENLVAFLVSL